MSGDTQVLGPASSSLLERISLRLTLPASLLAVPILIFLAIIFFYPAINLLFFSLLTQDAKGIVGPPLTLAHYARFFEIDLYLRVFWNTLRISLVTSAFAIVLGYPVAIVMARSGPIVSRIIALIVIAPLIVSVVVRSYGWQLILANTPAGLLNWVLMSLGITSTPLAILYSETAVVIGSLHVFFPMMVLPLASALGKIDPNLEDCARTLEGVRARHPAAQRAGAGGGLHPGVLADRRFLRHAGHPGRHHRHDAGQPDRAADIRGL